MSYVKPPREAESCVGQRRAEAAVRAATTAVRTVDENAVAA
jgi:hypothetical protein